MGAIQVKEPYENTTYIVFAINQLSPSSISISPLTTIQPRILQHSPGRVYKPDGGWITWIRVY